MRGSRTFGESLIAALGLIGFIALLWQGSIATFDDVWLYVAALGATVIFYFLLLLCRAIFTFMAGNDQFWWEKYEETKKKK